MPPDRPVVIVLGGVNGAGKSTAARALLAEQLAVTTFVNADEIARGLNAFAPESVAFEAGRIMLRRLRELATALVDFGFETTLAGRTYLPFLRDLRRDTYVVELHYFWLRSPGLAIERVRDRVRTGGHGIPEATILRRYDRSIRGFWQDYRTVVDSWFVYDNSPSVPALIAAGTGTDTPEVGDLGLWALFRRRARDA
jgi:predicted ABC-type ATPase